VRLVENVLVLVLLVVTRFVLVALTAVRLVVEAVVRYALVAVIPVAEAFVRLVCPVTVSVEAVVVANVEVPVTPKDPPIVSLPVTVEVPTVEVLAVR
jgi:hypothetical protein